MLTTSAYDSRVARGLQANHDSSAPCYTFSLFFSGAQGSWHLGNLDKLLLLLYISPHGSLSGVTLPVSRFLSGPELDLNSENNEKNRIKKKKIQTCGKKKKEDIKSYLPEDWNVFLNFFN